MCDLLNQFSNDKHLQGSIQLFLTEGVTCLDDKDNVKSQYIGDNKGFKLMNEKEQIDIVRDRCGKTQLLNQVTSKLNLKFLSVQQDMNMDAIKRILSGGDVAPIAQSANTNLVVDTFDFTAVGADLNCSYQITDSTSGVKKEVLSITAMSLDVGGTALVEGVDYAVDSKRFGKIIFLKDPAGIVNVSVSNTAVNATPFEVEASNSVQGKLTAFYYPQLNTLGEECEPEMKLEAIVTLNFTGEIGLMTEAATEPEITWIINGSPRILDLRTAS